MEEETFLMERYKLVMMRVREIPEEIGKRTTKGFLWEDFFSQMASWMIGLDNFREWKLSHDFKDWSLEEWQSFYEEMYRPLRQDYEISYADPDRATQSFGKAYGQLFSFLASEIYRSFSQWMTGHLEAVVILWELFVEVYTDFVYGEEEGILPSVEAIAKAVYWYVSDYSDEMVSWRIHEQQEPDFSSIKSIIMSEDLTDLRYLYRFGEYISDTELGTAEYMNRLSEKAINAMAETFVDGYIRGFEINRISLENKKYAALALNECSAALWRNSGSGDWNRSFSRRQQPFSIAVRYVLDIREKVSILNLSLTIVKIRLFIMIGLWPTGILRR